MVGAFSTRNLFHLALKTYFAMSLALFLWYGNKYGYTQSNQNDHSMDDDAFSFHMTLSLRNLNREITNGDVADGQNGTMSDKLFFKNIIKDEINNIAENYVENLTLDSDDVNSSYIHDFENSQMNRQEKLEMHDGRFSVKESNKSSQNIVKNSMIPKWIQMTKEQNSLYKYPVIQRVKGMDVFYISAIATDLSSDQNLSGKDVLNTVAINGWQGKKNEKDDLYCCFKLSESISSSGVFMTNLWDVPDIKVVKASQFICNISADFDQHVETYVGLSGKPTCKQVEYVKLKVEIKPPSGTNNSFAVCGKIVYGNFPATRLIEWFEVNKAFGVDHFSLFTYNVTKETMTVLKNYQEEGFLSVQEFDFPMKLRYPRYLGQKYMMAYMDEQVAVFDCVKRFRRYTYIAVLDVDEFIMPKMGHTNYKHMMKTLLMENPTAAGFTLMTSLFVTDWQKSHPEADFTIGQYTLRTLPMWDRRKSIFVSDRVHLPSVWTHGFDGKGHFRRVYLFKTKVVIYHYRKCRSSWIENDTCHNHRQQNKDVSMKKFLSNIRNTLLSKRKLLLHF